MKKILSILAMLMMVVGLSGCMDDPDGASGKVNNTVQLDLK